MPYANNAGIGLNYDAVGDGPPAVLVHANPFDWRLWRFQVEDFSYRYRMTGMEPPGCGL